MDKKNNLTDILQKYNLPELYSDPTYEKLGLKFNPFPKSGTTNINSSSSYIGQLSPIDEDIEKQVLEYLLSTLFAKTENAEDKFLGVTILGDYGSGKTQLLMYIKYMLGLFGMNKDHHKNPYTIYIDNPGVKLNELIGNIISEIGEENFSKFLWSTVISSLESDYKEELSRQFPTNNLFSHESDPWSLSYKVNYKKFIDAWKLDIGSPRKLKELEDKLKEYILEVLRKITHDNVVATYFYNILINDIGVNTSWESIVKGNAKQLNGKEANIIKAIVQLLYDEGFTHVFVLVDEFEDVTKGRLSKSQADNYLYSLRTLIDKERNWTTVFAMTFEAFEKLTEMSPPLSDRISSRKILLNTLRKQDSKAMFINYLNLAREDEDERLEPFTPEAIDFLTEKCRGNPRLVLSSAFKLIEVASYTGIPQIDSEFVNEHIAL